MNEFFNILKKSLILGILLIFGFTFTYVPQHFNKVPEAQALWPTIEVSPMQVNSAISTAADVVLTAKDTVLDAVGWAIAKTIISSLIGSLITWINSGFKGSPAFVQDLKRNLLDVADRFAGEFIKGLGGIGSFICSPFQLDIQLAISLEYQRIREDEPIEACRLSDIVNNIEDFYNGSFGDKGLEDFITITSSPEEYTPYGQLLTARSSFKTRLANEKGERLIEVDWGGGFLSGKICQAVESAAGSTEKKEKCVISKPGRTIADSLNKALGAGQDQLVAADEINELIAALIGQLANQALTGVAGLLGLSSGTGYTSPGFEGGSYLNAATAQAAGQLNTSSAASGGFTVEVLDTAITDQNQAISLGNQYVNQLNAYANNPRRTNDQRDNARSLATNAANVRDKALEAIPVIQTIRAELIDLEAELKQASTTIERKQAIAERKSALYVEFIKLGTYSKKDLATLEQAWKSALI